MREAKQIGIIRISIYLSIYPSIHLCIPLFSLSLTCSLALNLFIPFTSSASTRIVLLSNGTSHLSLLDWLGFPLILISLVPLFPALPFVSLLETSNSALVPRRLPLGFVVGIDCFKVIAYCTTV